MFPASLVAESTSSKRAKAAEREIGRERERESERDIEFSSRAESADASIRRRLGILTAEKISQ